MLRSYITTCERLLDCRVGHLGVKIHWQHLRYINGIYKLETHNYGNSDMTWLWHIGLHYGRFRIQLFWRMIIFFKSQDISQQCFSPVCQLVQVNHSKPKNKSIFQHWNIDLLAYSGYPCLLLQYVILFLFLSVSHESPNFMEKQY